mmetsp:Transcript_16901/g.25105  ORF Transcript_16901/g.25105 Transcript_16901/m.25105 type:complete len:92 (+) Transcript_16901:327-602(+)
MDSASLTISFFISSIPLSLLSAIVSAYVLLAWIKLAMVSSSLHTVEGKQLELDENPRRQFLLLLVQSTKHWTTVFATQTCWDFPRGSHPYH